MNSNLRNSPQLATAGFLLSGVIFFSFAFRFFNFAEDDAFIPMRYAMNFWQGFGWVMNPGEHVEGCTSPLQLALVTLLLRLASPDTALYILKFLGIFVGFAVLRQAQNISKALFPAAPWLVAVTPLLIALRPDFAVSMINGLETGLATLLVTGGIAAFLSAGQREGADQRQAALWFLGAALARPELTLIFPLLLIASGKRAMLSLRAALLLYVAPLVVLLLCRFAFYGSLVPNTYWAKHLALHDALPRGLNYLLDFALPTSAYLAAAFYLLGTLRLLSHGIRTAAVIFIPLAFHALFLLRSGGDWMADGRFFVVMLPLCVSVWSAAILQVIEFGTRIVNELPRLRPALYTSAFALAIITLYLLAEDTHERAYHLSMQPGIKNFAQTIRPHVPLEEWKIGNADGRLAMGRWIAAHARPGQMVLTSEMGLDTIINPQIRFLDMRGLTNREIARMPGVTHDISGAQGERDWMDQSKPLGRYLHECRPEWVALLWTVYSPDSSGVTAINDLYVPAGTFTIYCDGRDLLVATWRRRDIPRPR